MLLGFVDLVVLQLVAELTLLSDELVDLAEDVFVFGHVSSVPRRRPAKHGISAQDVIAA